MKPLSRNALLTATLLPVALILAAPSPASAQFEISESQARKLKRFADGAKRVARDRHASRSESRPTQARPRRKVETSPRAEDRRATIDRDGRRSHAESGKNSEPESKTGAETKSERAARFHGGTGRDRFRPERFAKPSRPSNSPPAKEKPKKSSHRSEGDRGENPKATGSPRKSEFSGKLEAEPADVGKMVSVLRGRGSRETESTTTEKKATPTCRRARLDSEVLPRGFQTFHEKTGRDPSSRVLARADERPGTATSRARRGHAGSEDASRASGPPRGDEARTAGRGRPDAAGAPGASPARAGAPDGARDSKSRAPRQVSYEVDSSSQLSTRSVKFRQGSTALADEASYRYLVNLSAALRSPELTEFSFVVEGHASAEGSAQVNLRLSQRRANAIYDFLVSQGVAPDMLFAVGHGESRARFAPHEPEYLLAQDRQVMVFRLAE